MEYIIRKKGNENNEVLLKDCETGKSGRKKTVFSAEYDDEGINFTFKCEDEDIYADMTQFNANLYEQDVVEVFISPDGNLAKYSEFEISPLGNVLQLRIENFDFDGGINATHIKEDLISRNVNMTENGWVAKFYIPFILIGSSDISRVWKFNAFRIDRKDASNFDPTDLKDEDFDYYALNPTYKAEYHRPQYFIDLIFEK